MSDFENTEGKVSSSFGSTAAAAEWIKDNTNHVIVFVILALLCLYLIADITYLKKNKPQYSLCSKFTKMTDKDEEQKPSVAFSPPS